MEAAALRVRARRPLLKGTLFPAVSDERLVEHIRSGDERAFEALYDRHHRALLAFCRHMLADQSEAEDVLQHTFVAALRAMQQPGRDIHAKAFLFAIARNRCLSVLRQRRESLALEDVDAPVDGLPAEVQRRADLQELIGDLRRLPEDQRAALVLSELDALGHDEIAGVLGVKRDKVKALVFQARENLMRWREARHADCRDIREQLSTLRGGALRRTQIRHHLEECESCRAFKIEVQRQRAAMAAVLPVAPGLALKGSVLAAALGGGAAATAGGAGAGLLGGGAAAGLTANSFFAKALVATVLAGSAGAGGYAAVEGFAPGDAPIRAPAVERSSGGSNAAPLAPSLGPPIVRVAPQTAAPAPSRKARGERRGAAGAEGKAKRRDRRAAHAPKGSTRPQGTPAATGPAAKATPGVPAAPATGGSPPGQTKAKGGKPAGDRGRGAAPGQAKKGAGAPAGKAKGTQGAGSSNAGKGATGPPAQPQAQPGAAGKDTGGGRPKGSASQSAGPGSRGKSSKGHAKGTRAAPGGGTQGQGQGQTQPAGGGQPQGGDQNAAPRQQPGSGGGQPADNTNGNGNGHADGKGKGSEG